MERNRNREPEPCYYMVIDNKYHYMKRQHFGKDCEIERSTTILNSLGKPQGKGKPSEHKRSEKLKQTLYSIIFFVHIHVIYF